MCTPFSHTAALQACTCKGGRLFRAGPPPFATIRSRSALRELEAPARLGPTVLLALDHARVAGQEAALLQDRTKVRLEQGQRPADAVAHRAGLPREAAAADRADHVELAVAAGRLERSEEHTSELQSLMRISYAVF